MDTFYFSVILSFLFYSISAQDCWEAPDETDRFLCIQMNRWDIGATVVEKTKKSNISDQSLHFRASQTVPMAYECKTISCICKFFGGSVVSTGCRMPDGTVFGKAIRKEYRLMSDDERRRFHDAIIQLKSKGHLDDIIQSHSTFLMAPGAHSGPAFLPWHREFIKRFEISLREIDSSLALPYWDSVLDGNIPNTKDSVLFSEELMGDTDENGTVISGPFANLKSHRIRRVLGLRGRPFSEKDMDKIVGGNGMERILAYSVPRRGCPQKNDFLSLEYLHGRPHTYIGGDMLLTATSANDPIFFLHHSFVDKIWEDWRQNRQTREQRETDFPSDNINCSSAAHFRNSSMRPFAPLLNRDGLLNHYTDNLYEYANRPSCTETRECGSRFLFCDLSHGSPRCASKIKVGGRCNGYERNEPMCYNSTCRNGTCVSISATTISPSTSSTTPSSLTTGTSSTLSTTTVELTKDLENTNYIQTLSLVSLHFKEKCFNNHFCCSHWHQQGECTNTPGFMRRNCMASCGLCKYDYDINIDSECSDRSSDCMVRRYLEGCGTQFMQENCRQACDACQITREILCNDSSTTSLHSNSYAVSTMIECSDSNQYCGTWAKYGHCQTNPIWMTQNCRKSCGTCHLRNPHSKTTIRIEKEKLKKDSPKWKSIGNCELFYRIWNM